MQVADLKSSQVLALFNKFAEQPVKKFPDRATGEKKLVALMAERGLRLVEANGEPALSGESPVVQREGDDATITLLVEANPKKPGSAAHGRFALYADSMSVAAFLAAGGTRRDLTWDAARNFIQLNGGA